MDSEGEAQLSTLVIERIVKRFGNTVALDCVSLEIRAGEIHALVGENGSGKSTLCKIISGDQELAGTDMHEGRVLLDGEPVAFTSPEDALRHGVAMVHQDVSLIPQMTVAENVTLGREPTLRMRPLAPVDEKAAQAASQNALAGLGVALDPGALAGELPIGAQQLVEAARESSRAGIKILVLDEPSAALSRTESELLLKLMTTLAGAGVAVLFVSHRLSEVLQVAHRVTVLRDGRVAGTVEAAEVSTVKLARLMVGDDDSDPVERAGSALDSIALEMQGLRVSMPGDPLRGLSLSVRRGEIVGVTSQAGHGRLAVGNGLLGFYPASGTLLVAGASVPIGSPVAMERAGLSVVHEDRREVGLELGESVAMNIALPSLIAGRRFLTARWFPGGGFPDDAAIHSAAEELVERFDVRCVDVGQAVGELSGGNQQKIAIARSVASKPTALIVVEPTRGVDVRAKDTILAALGSIADEGVGVVVVSGDVGELDRICDRIVVLREGRKSAEYLPPFDAVEIELAVLGEDSGAGLS